VEFGLMRSATEKADKSFVYSIRKWEEGNFLEKSDMLDSVTLFQSLEGERRENPRACRRRF